jgi:hypothetical protein
LPGNYVYWEDLTDDQKDEILNSNAVNKEALAFYKGEQQVSDNSKTIALLDTLSSITSSEKKTTSFYFFLFNQICIKADGALAEMLGDYCQRIVLNSPEYVINYFIKNENVLKKYAQYLGYELYFKEEGTSAIEYNYSDFKKMLSGKLKNTEQYKDVLMLFYSEIEKSMKNTN